ACRARATRRRSKRAPAAVPFPSWGEFPGGRVFSAREKTGPGYTKSAWLVVTMARKASVSLGACVEAMHGDAGPNQLQRWAQEELLEIRAGGAAQARRNSCPARHTLAVVPALKPQI